MNGLSNEINLVECSPYELIEEMTTESLYDKNHL